MKNCKNCANRCVYTCDVYGDIPVHDIERELNCPSFEQLADGEKTLRAWLAGVDAGSLESDYIQSLLNAMELKPSPGFDGALHWLYSIKDSKGVRAVRAACHVFDIDSSGMPF